MSKQVIYVNNISRAKTKFLSTEITEEFITGMRSLFWTTVTVLAVAVVIIFLGLWFYLIRY